MSTVKTAWQAYVEGSDGLPLPGATITVTNERTGSLATIYSDRAGTAKTNPFTSDSDGLVRFYADNGRYKIVAVSGSETSTLRDVPIGNMQESDTVESYARSPLVTDDIDDGFLIGQIWRDTSTSPNDYYLCDDNTAGAAVWLKMLFQGGAGATTANSVSWDNTGSTLTSSNAQAVIDEIADGGAKIGKNGFKFAGVTAARDMRIWNDAGLGLITIGPATPNSDGNYGGILAFGNNTNGGTDAVQMTVTGTTSGFTNVFVYQEGASPEGYIGAVTDAATGGTTNVIEWDKNGPVFPLPLVFPEYTVAGVPSAANYDNAVIIVSNETGGRTLATSDGTNWRRVSDGAVIS